MDKCESKLLVESLRNLQDNEVTSIHTEIHSQIQGEVEEHSKSGKIKEEAGEADMRVEVRCVVALQQLCQTNANITQLALDAALCTVRGEGVKTAEVHQAAKLTLTTKLTNSKTTRCSAVVVGQLKSLYDGSVFKCDVDQSRPGEYRIQYTPTVRGRHKLTVSVDGQQVAGSPFPVSVFIPPTQLGKPVKVLYGVHHAGGITINTAGDILVTEYDGDIVKFNTKGKKSVLVTHSESEVKWLESISTDDKGSIYCTHSETNKVTKCTKNGGNIQVHEVKQVTGSGHWSVTVVGDEVMMCEMNNEGTIMVYDRELKYVRRIELHDPGEFTGMSTDIHGNLYVTDSVNDCIQVFSNDGVYLHSFGSDGNGKKRLNRPHDVCVFGHYLYAINSCAHYLSVFTTVGDYVTTLGDEEDSFDLPCGVCADEDGFVYVAYSISSRVKCF